MSAVMSFDDSLEPVVGVAAFSDASRSAIASRAAQYLGMAAYAFGGDDLAQNVQDDANILAVLHVRNEALDLQLWSEPGFLDDITDSALRHHWGRSWDGSYDPEGAAALWEELNANHLPTTLLALLNYAQRSDQELEAVSAAGSLSVITRNEATIQSELMQRGSGSDDPLTRGVATAFMGGSDGLAQSAMQSSLPALRLIDPTSTLIHGTWGLVTDDGWHKPGSPMHHHLRSTVTGNLYDGNEYYVWNGGYSDQDRASGASDLSRWRDVVSDVDWLDTVYAHSHGGNVALNSLAMGQRIKMLVLLHTPAIHRSDEDWAKIRESVRTVVVMRTRMDLVVLADSLRHRENRLKFNPSKLPHFPVVDHWKHRDAWLSHSHFINVENWIRDDLSDIVRTRYALIT